MPNSYSRQRTKMFVDRGCEVFCRRESERRSWSGRRRYMKWAPFVGPRCATFRAVRQERLQKEQAKTGDANQNKPTHMDHHGSTCHLVSHCRVEWELSIFSWPTPRARRVCWRKWRTNFPHKHQKLQPIDHGFALNHFVARHTGSDDVSSYDLAFTMPPTVSNQSKEKIC